jgi:hypothetical protein
MQRARFYSALKSLSDAGVDFILVGGLAALPVLAFTPYQRIEPANRPR